MFPALSKKGFNMYGMHRPTKMLFKRQIAKLPTPYYQGNDINLHMNELRWDIYEIIDDRFFTLQKELKKTNKKNEELDSEISNLRTEASNLRTEILNLKLRTKKIEISQLDKLTKIEPYQTKMPEN